MLQNNLANKLSKTWQLKALPETRQRQRWRRQRQRQQHHLCCCCCRCCWWWRCWCWRWWVEHIVNDIWERKSVEWCVECGVVEWESCLPAACLPAPAWQIIFVNSTFAQIATISLIPHAHKHTHTLSLIHSHSSLSALSHANPLA